MLLRTSTKKLPHVVKSCKPSASTSKLPYPPVRNMAFFPHFAGGDFGPIFRLLDDYDEHRSAYRKQSPNHNQGLNHSHSHTPVRSFAPKFDVRELNDSYRLDGELPGIDQNNIDIEFTDPHTLVIKGRVERESHDGNLGLPENRIESASDDDEGASTKSPHQPTVEDDMEENDGAATTKAMTAPTATSSEEISTKPARPAFKYWVSERSVGEFHRAFSFPTRVDQDAVRASLKNGILSIVVPKAQAPKAKKIRIE